MDLSPTAILAAISLLVVLLTAFAGIVAGFVRMESKSNLNSTEINDLWKTVESHNADRSVHHPADELDRRFGTLETTLTKIERGIDKLGEKVERFILGK